MTSKIGIIAGGGQFPYLFAEAAQKAGRHVVIIGHKGETHPELEKIADSFYWIKLGQLGKILRYFRKKAFVRDTFCKRIFWRIIVMNLFISLPDLTIEECQLLV